MTAYEPRDRLDDLAAVVAWMAGGWVVCAGLGLQSGHIIALIAGIAVIAIYKRL